MPGASRASQALVCARTQALSVTMRKHTLEAAARNVLKLRQAVDKCKATDANRLTTEYNRLVAGLQVRGASCATQTRLNKDIDHSAGGSAREARSAHPGSTSTAAGGRQRWSHRGARDRSGLRCQLRRPAGSAGQAAQAWRRSPALAGVT
jgi:hypothetical protein